ncbi:MAG: nucleotidyltransferase family protein [Dehalococcoidia bacterium]|nr:nucleotidyltransferase family protein [Dehalococcoidia bacterium]
MHDVDLLIRPPGFMKAAGALLNAGWQPLRGDREDYFRRIRVFHALPLASPDSVEVDLHRYMLEENCWPDVDSSLFEHLAKGRVGDDDLTTLRPEDHVINACVHGTRWDPVPSLRWVVDTVVIVRAAGSAFDWEYLVHQSVRRRVTLSMAAALEFAADYEPSIPGPTIEELRIVPAGRLQRLDFRAQQGADSAGFQVLRYLTRYARLTSRRSLYRKAADFPTYLECMWELDRPRQVPLEGLRRVFRRLRGGQPGRSPTDGRGAPALSRPPSSPESALRNRSSSASQVLASAVARAARPILSRNAPSAASRASSAAIASASPGATRNPLSPLRMR